MRIPHTWLRSAVLALASGLTGASLPAAAADQPIHQLSAEVCKGCHQEIYRQWQGSMHAQSTALADPIHGAFYRQEVGDPKAEGQLHKQSKTFPVCLSCHAPNAARDKTTKLDAKPAYSEGVNCMVCHTLAGYKGIKGEGGKLRLGLAAYETSDRLQGPTGFPRGVDKLTASGDMFGGAVGSTDETQKPNPHLGEPVEFRGEPVPALPLEPKPVQLRTSDACLGCHDQRNNPKGVPLCQTGNEYAAGGTKVACQSCHMAVSGGLSDHSMSGGHSEAMLKRSVVFDLKTEPAGDKLKARVRLQNLQPHSMPTGAPFRNLHLKLAAYNASGEAVWESAKGHPSKDDPQGYFTYSMVDDQGKPAMPPVATKPGKDTRLKPYETRELGYEIPAEGVVLVRGELYYSLLWPALAEKLNQLPVQDRTPVLIAVSESPTAIP
jgi:nitrate/TMAO reductase-like tetraheme cytochrome c subunit